MEFLCLVIIQRMLSKTVSKQEAESIEQNDYHNGLLVAAGGRWDGDDGISKHGEKN